MDSGASRNLTPSNPDLKSEIYTLDGRAYPSGSRTRSAEPNGSQQVTEERQVLPVPALWPA